MILSATPMDLISRHTMGVLESSMTVVMVSDILGIGTKQKEVMSPALLHV